MKLTFWSPDHGIHTSGTCRVRSALRGALTVLGCPPWSPGTAPHLNASEGRRQEATREMRMRGPLCFLSPLIKEESIHFSQASHFPLQFHWLGTGLRLAHHCQNGVGSMNDDVAREAGQTGTHAEFCPQKEGGRPNRAGSSSCTWFSSTVLRKRIL